ncbi:hypothetical protein TheveDRAFT_0517 [Thermanaerovibrio velox DSM 12556]|uniref:Uncharacterized protein n=1 Tax=Thermanaerovibrio velox DSM 12556 TaxID=926567 RepID=H0UQ49_9BACT|nr:hypothetical protein [Thermanaerovibrio velox]EHM09678.1 hypothetical protein TheveDRAFT_0517 [Thermanaerovibrio velox DSM 12556]
MAVERSLRQVLGVLGAAGAALFVLTVLGFPVRPCFAASPEETVALHLDRWSAIRWGSDCVVWLVHYPEEMVPAWVNLESKRRGLSPKDASAYERSFREQLRMNTSRPFLLTIQVFGSPLRLAPLKDKLSLSSKGRVFKPSAYDRRLDQPISGLVQGLVFFPREAVPPYRIEIKGILPSPVVVELPSTPSGGAGTGDLKGTASPVKPQEASRGSSRSYKGDEKEGAKAPEVRVPTPKRTERPVAEAPQAAPKPRKEDLNPRQEPKPSKGQGSETVPVPKDAKGTEESIQSHSVPPEQPKVQPPKKEEPQRDDRKAMEEALKAFLDAWRRDDLEAAYGMMSSMARSQGKDQLMSRLGSHPFRWALKEGYRVSIEGDSARVSATQRFLMVKMIKTETFRLVEEGGRYRVDW